MGHVSQLKDLNSDTSRHQGMVHRLTEERNAERARAQELEMKLRQMAADASVQAQLAQLTAWRSQLDREKQLLSDRCVLCWGGVIRRFIASRNCAHDVGGATGAHVYYVCTPPASGHVYHCMKLASQSTCSFILVTTERGLLSEASRTGH